ncbi:MAG TPA: DUF3857 domain-containing protein [Acidobacteriota bacterium]|nr:DUF3857 domain-containing protein [Acidobacteriota bacterium]
MKRFSKLLAVLCLLWIAMAPQQDIKELRQLAASAPAADRYPTSDALLLLAETRVQIEADGVVRTRLHNVAKIFTPSGVQRYSIIRLPFSSSDSIVKLIHARSLMADGSIQALGEEVLDGSPIYKSARDYAEFLEAVIAVPGVEAGSVVESLISLNKRNVDPRRVNGWVSFRQLDTAREQVLAIRVPGGVDLHYAYSSDIGKPQIRESIAARVYSWRALNRPPLPLEPLGPDRGSVGSRVLFSTYGSWEEVYKHLADNFSETGLSGEAAALAESLSEGEPTEVDIASRLEEILNNRITRISLDYELAGYQTRGAQQVFDSGFGYDLDIAVLAAAFLKRAGVAAHPALLAASRDFVRDVPAPIQFDRIAIIIGAGEEQVWLYPDDPLSNSLGQPPYGRTVLRMLPDGYRLEKIDELPVEKNSAQSRYEIRLRPDGSASGNTYASCSGIFNPVNVLGGGNEYLRDLAKTQLEWPGSEPSFDNAFILHRSAATCRFELSWTAKGVGKRSGDLLTVVLPPSILATPADALPLFKSTRRTPVVFSSPWEQQHQIDVKVLDSMKPLLQPINLSIINRVGRIDIRSDYHEDDAELTIERYLRIETSEISASAYPALRELLSAWRSPATRTAIFAAAETPSP